MLFVLTKELMTLYRFRFKKCESTYLEIKEKEMSFTIIIQRTLHFIILK